MIQLDWDNPEHTILRYTFSDPWTWDEYYATNPQRDHLFASVDHTVDIILDFTQGKRMPPEAMTNFRKAASWDSSQRGVIVIIGVNMMLQALANIMVKVYPQAATKAPRPARDLAHARDIITDIQRKRSAEGVPTKAE